MPSLASTLKHLSSFARFSAQRGSRDDFFRPLEHATIEPLGVRRG